MKPLTNLDNEEIIKNEKGLEGCYPSDILSKKCKGNGIINFSDSSKSNGHCTAFYNDSKSKFIKYFDPMGWIQYFDTTWEN